MNSAMEEVLQLPNHQQLKHEFHDILFNSMINPSVATDTTNISIHYDDYNALNPEEIKNLRRISTKLRSTDYFQDCFQIYITTRKETVDRVFGQLHKKMNSESVRVFAYWEDLSEKIGKWIQMVRICVENVFLPEKIFYEHIFGGSGAGEDADEGGYVHIIGDSAAKLFDEFPDSLMSSGRRSSSSQILEILLPVYQEFLNLMPVLEALFPEGLCLNKSIPDRASGTVCRLSRQIKRLIFASERHVLRELSINTTPAGAVHPLTEYVINYIHLIFNYRKSLSDLIGEVKGSNDLIAAELDSLELEQDQSIPLKHHFTRIIEYLLYNLRYKSKFYDHESLRHLFMMNNVNHVAQKIGNSRGLHEIIGSVYLAKLRNKVKEYMTSYLKTTWNCVFLCLREEKSKRQGKWSSPFRNSNRDVKEKFKNFNLMIKNVHLRLDKLEVPDKHLRQKLCQSILINLIPAYRKFLAQHSRQIDKFQHPERYIKYSVKELEKEIMNLFSFKNQLKLQSIQATGADENGSSMSMNTWMSNMFGD